MDIAYSRGKTNHINLKSKQVKKIISIIFAAIALAACDPVESDKTDFKADDIIQTQWKGILQTVQGSAVNTTADITLEFGTSGKGLMVQKRKGVASKESYDMAYSISGKKITFDCPVITGAWDVSVFKDNTMVLTQVPSGKSMMTLEKMR